MSYAFCLASPKNISVQDGLTKLVDMPPALRYLNLTTGESRGDGVRVMDNPPLPHERIPDFATNDSTSVVYDTAPRFLLEPGARVTFAAEGLPKGVSIDKESGRITGVVDHSASSGIDGSGVYNVRITASDGDGGDSFRYFTWTVNNLEPEARPDFGTTSEEGWVVGNVITGEGSGAEVSIEDGMYTVRPAMRGAGRDFDPDGDPLDISMVAGHPANVGQPVTCPGGGILTMHADGDYSFRAPSASEDQPAAERPLLLVPYAVNDSDGAVDTGVLFLDQSNSGPAAPGSESAGHVLVSVDQVEAQTRHLAGARLARAAGDETSDLRGLLDDRGDNDLSPLLEKALATHAGAGSGGSAEAGGQGVDAVDSSLVIPAAPELVAVDYAAPPTPQVDMSAALLAELLCAGMVTASLS